MIEMRNSTLPLAPPKEDEGQEPLHELPAPSDAEWPLLPTETELYILPDGQVVVADLPIELQTLLTSLGRLASDADPLSSHE